MQLLPLLSGIALLAGVTSVHGQELPQTRDDVATPGGTLPGDPQIALVKVADGFQDPTGVASAFDGTGRIFVTERVGRIKLVNQDGTVNDEPFLDLTQVNELGNIVQHQFVEQGLYAVAFHPNFSDNGHFFVHYASLPFNGDGMIVRITVDPESPDAVTAEQVNETLKVIMRIPQPYYNHNGGEIIFGPDGYLYIASGDGGWEGDVLEAGQDLSTWLGKILRIDVDVEEDSLQPYRIPQDNPYRDAVAEREMVLFGLTEEDFSKIRPNAKPEIWHYGLRNPYQMDFDPETGDLGIAEVGQNHWEEINWQPAGMGGLNLGWPRLMGTHCHPLLSEDQECPIVGTLPVAEYPHSEPYPGAEQVEEGSGCSVQGLGVARYGGMNGVFLTGDWCTGRVFGAGWDADASAWVLQELVQTDLQFTGGGRDEDGTVLAVNCNCFYLADQGPEENPPGALWRVVPAGEVPEGAETATTVQ
jgi:glucose/arabinose dehydrogenase